MRAGTNTDMGSGAVAGLVENYKIALVATILRCRWILHARKLLWQGISEPLEVVYNSRELTTIPSTRSDHKRDKPILIRQK